MWDEHTFDVQKIMLWHLSFMGRVLPLTVPRLSCVGKALSRCYRYFQDAAGARQ